MSAGPEQFDFARLADIPDPLARSRRDAKAESASDASSDPGDADATGGDGSGAGEAMRAKVLAEPRPLTRSQVHRRRLVAISVSLVWFVALLFAAGFQRDVPSAREAFIGQVVLPAALGFVVMVAALARGRLGLGPRLEWLIGLTLAAPALFAVAALASSAAPGARDPSLIHHALACCSIAILVATVPMVAATYGLRRVSVTNAPWRSALVGVGIGLISAAVLGMHCSSTDGAHLITGHLTPVILLGLSALVVIRRYARAD